jgi:IclR family pca regulon transcriptional regulator
MKKDREFITSLARGLSVIQAFDREHPQMTLSEVAARTGLSPATARRCLYTLEQLGFVGTNGRAFLLRPKVVSLGSAFLASARVEEIIQPILRSIVEQAGSSASLAVLDGDNVLYVANFSAKRLVQLTAGVGTRFPAYAVSMGRVLLAQLSDKELDAYLKRTKFERLTRWTVTDPATLRKRILEARRLGYAAMQDELEEGLGAVAIPVAVAPGPAVMALNCSAYSRTPDRNEMVKTRLPVLLKAAEQVAEAVRQFPVLSHSFGLSQSAGGAAPEPSKPAESSRAARRSQ